MKQLESHVLCGGLLQVWQHDSQATQTNMRFAVYLPDALKHTAGEQTENSYHPPPARRWPVLYWLSGLTCTEQNFIQKSGFAQYAAQHQIMVVVPDTSPRGEDVADSDRYDLGQGASFYVNATQAPWREHYQMFDYITQELPALVEQHFPASDRRSIAGHSMGGHGALMIALRTDQRYASASAFAPIVAPSQVPWGQQAFTAYLGHDPAQWAKWDTVALLSALQHQQLESPVPMLIDQGLGDEFLQMQLQPERLEQAAQLTHYPLTVRHHAGYDHSYYFISSFLGEHFAFHARHLKG